MSGEGQMSIIYREQNIRLHIVIVWDEWITPQFGGYGFQNYKRRGASHILICLDIILVSMLKAWGNWPGIE